jgi:hypothetical protein
MIATPAIQKTEDFSLVLGGPLYQLLLRSGLIRPPFGNISSRIAVITGLTWLPLLVLSGLDSRVTAGVKVPFLYDFEVQARLLVAIPLMILAEVIVYLRMRAIAAQFTERHIVTESLRQAFDNVVASAVRLRNSVPAEIALLLLVVIGGSWLWREALALRFDAWHATITSSGLELTSAGRWYAYVSVPVFQFILLRWYYRLFIWSRLLFQVAKLDLNLVPTHPDRCCGLGFLGNIVFAFAPLLMAHSALISGVIANRIIYEGATLPDFRFDLAGTVCFLLLIALAPLCVFCPKLSQARISGLRTYGTLASQYVTDFAVKWAGIGRAGSEPLLGTADIQSLADLDNSFSIVREIRLVPFGKDTIVRFLVVIALPLAPLAFTMFSVEELIRRLIAVLL